VRKRRKKLADLQKGMPTNKETDGEYQAFNAKILQTGNKDDPDGESCKETRIYKLGTRRNATKGGVTRQALHLSSLPPSQIFQPFLLVEYVRR
jgi:hypothetical protein